MSKDNKSAMIRDINKVQISLYGEDSIKIITRTQYRKYGAYSEWAWRKSFGNFQEFRRQAGLIPRRELIQVCNQISKHASVDHLKKLNKERKEWGKRYVRKNRARFQTLLGAADFHDINTDPFVLRVFLETAYRAQPDIICFAGDIYDHSEFGKFNVDPRLWNPVERMQFVNANILGEVRQRCKKTQIDIIEGNHERRLLKHLTNNSPATKVFLSDWLNLTIKDLLKLDELQINYIAEADLTAWTKRNETEELAKNFKIYYDCLVVHHYSNQGRAMGYPGFSGHNHKHELWHGYSPIFGSYEWHQLGCCCRRDVNYTEGLKWSNGFILAHIDTKDKLVNFEYIPITNHAAVGGKFYYRKNNEVVIAGRK